MTQIYLSTEQSTTYWSLPKFLSRSKWSVDEPTSSLTRQVRNVFSEGVYVYDETSASNNGIKQFGTHFFIRVTARTYAMLHEGTRYTNVTHLINAHCAYKINIFFYSL